MVERTEVTPEKWLSCHGAEPDRGLVWNAPLIWFCGICGFLSEVSSRARPTKDLTPIPVELLLLDAPFRP